MKVEEFEEILRKTLEDGRISRSERKAIRARLEDADPTPEQFAQFRAKAFQIASEEASKGVTGWLEDVIKMLLPSPPPPTNMRAFFSPGETCRDANLRAIEGATRKIDICVFTITDNVLSNAIIDAHQRGLMLRIITDNDKSEDRGSDIDRFRREGIHVMVDDTDKHMHHKFALFDGEYVLTGSYNWTRSAAAYNQENIIITDDEEIISAFEEEFERLFVQFY